MENIMKNNSATNAPLDMNKWREIIEAWNESNENQKDYCQRLGVNLNTFTYVRSKLLQQEKSKSHFIPLTIKSNKEETVFSSSMITLENPHGYKLHLSASLSSEQLAKLFKLS